jgi:glycosyltransferase involved in cell wall biosynthesis
MEGISKSNYKILHISRMGSKNGGAAAFRTHRALTKAGHHSDLLLKCSYDDPDTKKMLSSFQVNLSRAKKKIASYLPIPKNTFQSNPRYCFFGVDEEEQLFDTNAILKKISFQPDIIVIYFMDEFLNYKNVYELQRATNAKIYIYPMDMGPITGGCHYAWDCGGYKTICTPCPAILNENEKNRASINLTLKKKYIESTDLTLLACGEWLMEKIKESYLFANKKSYKLLLPVDSNLFRPYPKNEAKKRFKLNAEKRIIFFGAQYLRDRRKGIPELLKSLQILSDLVRGTQHENKIELLVAGREEKTFLEALPFEYKFVGLIDNDTELPYAYSAADIFVCPSVQDAGPMMINESVMSGTPVVAFNMGVARDIVISGRTGYKVELYDCEDFANGILEILNKTPEQYQQLCDESRRLAMTQYSLSSLASRFEDILEKDFKSSAKDLVV